MRTYILSDSEQLVSQVRQALLRRGYDFPPDHVTPLAAYPLLANVKPNLVVLGLSPDPERALVALGEVRPLFQGPVLAVGPGTDPKLILRTLRAGASEFLVEDDLAAEFDGALLRYLGGASGTSGGRTLAVLGAAGGCGASTLAVNLAAALTRDHGGSILVDLKLETGDLAALLDIQPQHTVADLCSAYSSPDRAMFEQSLSTHASGIRLLASPRRQASTIRSKASLAGPGVTPDTVRELLTLARDLSPYTVVEVSPTFREEQTQALRMADAVLLVLRLDYTSIRNARRVIDHLDQIEIDRTRLRLVGSRPDQPHALPPAYVEEVLGLKFFHLVPDDPKAMNTATNVGEPAVFGLPKSPSARSLRQLAAALAGTRE